MDEIVALVVKKTGLPKETAQQVVKIVIDFVKTKLPPQFASQVDAILAGKGVMSALDDGKLDMNDAANLLGGFLGGGDKPAPKKKGGK
jgi:hypothetical protein